MSWVLNDGEKIVNKKFVGKLLFGERIVTVNLIGNNKIGMFNK